MRLLAAAVGVSMASSLLAQQAYFVDVTDSRLPPDLAGPCMDAAAGDADGDGDLDIALAMEFEPNILLINDGSGRFTRGVGRLPDAQHDSEDVAYADFDGDGDLDLVLVSEDDRTDELYRNEGAGRYRDASSRLPTNDVSNALAVMDLDGDGLPDVLTGNIGTDRVLISDGAFGFRDETADRWPQDGQSRTQDLELADVDGDGALDVIVGNEGQNELFLNRDGRLVDATAGRLPMLEDETREVRAGDVDGDGDLDLVVANVSFVMSASPQDYLLLNDGSGRFTMAEQADYPEDARSNFTVQLADLDRDGDLDAVLPSTVFARTSFEFLVFVTDADGRAVVVRVPNANISDVDGDGDTDVVELAADGSVLRAYLNEDGRLRLPDADADADADAGGRADARVPARDDAGTGEVGVAAAADAPRLNRLEEVDTDDDGRPDLTIGTIELYASDPAVSPADTSADGAGRTTFQLADIDYDGDIDVAIPRTVYLGATGDYLVLVNDGSGRFSRAAPGTLLPVESTGNGFDVEVADFDADGRADLFLCNRASTREPGTAALSGGLQRLLLYVGRD